MSPSVSIIRERLLKYRTAFIFEQSLGDRQIAGWVTSFCANQAGSINKISLEAPAF